MTNKKKEKSCKKQTNELKNEIQKQKKIKKI